MIGLQRVLHAEQKSEPQYSEHLSPARLPFSIYISHTVCQSKISSLKITAPESRPRHFLRWGASHPFESAHAKKIGTPVGICA
jgi:hypothetical protein